MKDSMKLEQPPDKRPHVFFHFVHPDGSTSAPEFALADFGSEVNLISFAKLKKGGFERYVLEFDENARANIEDANHNPLLVRGRVRMRVNVWRQHLDVRTPVDQEVWFWCWVNDNPDENVILSAQTLEELGFYIAHISDGQPPMEYEDDQAFWEYSTSQEAKAQYIVNERRAARTELYERIFPELEREAPEWACSAIKDLFVANFASVFRANLLPGDRFKNVTQFASEPSDKLHRPRPQQAYAPNSWKHRIMLAQLATLFLVGIIVLPEVVSQFAIYMFLANAHTAPRAVANTGAVAGNVVKVEPSKLRKLEDQIKKQADFSIRAKFDIKGAFHLNVLKNGASPDITQVRYGDKTFQFTRTIMGEANSAEFLNRVLDEIFGDLPWLSRWMDDLLLGATDWRDFVNKLKIFIERCDRHGVVLNIEKIRFGKEIYWCGHWFRGTIVKSDSHTKEILTSLEEPKTGDQLAKIIGSAEWFSKFVPGMHNLLRPLRSVMETIYKTANSRENKKVAKFKVRAFGWTDDTTRAFEKLKEALRKHQELHLRDPRQVLLLYCDASATGFSGILFQCREEEVHLRPTDRRQTLLECCGGSFTASQMNWPTVEQEAYAVIHSIHRFWHHLNDGSKLYIFTDNQVLSYVFDQDSDYVRKKDRPGQGRLLRWIAKLMEIHYCIQHVPGEQNVFADVLSRQSTYPKDEVPLPEEERADIENGIRPMLLGRVAAVRIKHNLWNLHDQDWVQPSLQEIRLYVGKDGMKDPEFAALAQRMKAKFDEEDGVWKISHRVVIPPVEDLRLRLIIAAHSNLGGHRGARTTLEVLQAVVVWRGMDKDVKRFVSECIHCLEKDSNLQDRPWGQPLNPQRRNDIVSFDYLHLGNGRGGVNRLLVITDKLTGYTHLHTAESESAQSAAQGLIKYMAKCGRPSTFLSDHGTAFDNQVLKELSEKLGVEHHFTPVRASWANGQQERLNLTIANLFRTLISENQMQQEDWPLLVDFVELVLNATPTARLGWKTPIECFLATEPVRPLDFFVDVHGDLRQINAEPKKLEAVVAEFQAVLAEREAVITEEIAKRHEALLARQAKKPGVVRLEVDKGDFVMVLDDREFKGKLERRWKGPAQVIEVKSEHLLTVKYLGRTPALTKPFEVHVRRLRKLDAASLAKTSELLQHAEMTTSAKWIVRKMLDLRKAQRGKSYEILVEWDAEGYDPTWEPLETMATDVPDLVIDFLEHGVPDHAKQLATSIRGMRYIKALFQKRGSVTV